MQIKCISRKIVFDFIIVILLISFISVSDTVEVHILHTNDIHDHVRPGYMGVGGMPYIAGYVAKVKSEKQNVILVDAGDITDKGDMVADLTDGGITFEALQRIGYDAITLGNHDLDKGIKQLCKLANLAPSVKVITTNYEDGIGCGFVPWWIIKVEEFPIGFVGIVKTEGNEKKVAELSLQRLKEAIKELKNEGCKFIIALSHLGSETCMGISQEIPEISVFISGHTHELLKQPRRHPKTQALVLQAGCYAMYLGHLMLKIDTKEVRILESQYNLVELRHDVVPCDMLFLQWITEREKELCPQASQFLIDNKKTIGVTKIAYLATKAFLSVSDADIAFCHPKLIIRSTLPPTQLDYNSIYRTGGHRAKEIVMVELTGKQIERYLVDLMKHQWGRTVWAGFDGNYERVFPADQVSVKTNLQENKKYKVVLSLREWENRLSRSLSKQNKQDEIEIVPTRCNFTFYDAVSRYIESLRQSVNSLDEYFDQSGLVTINDEESMEMD